LNLKTVKRPISRQWFLILAEHSVERNYSTSQNLTGCTVTLIYNGTNEVDCCSDYEDRKPTSMGLCN